MSWPKRFLGLFREIASQLGSILNANGCREGWLQGEFHLHFRAPKDGFRVNYSCDNTGAKYEWPALPTRPPVNQRDT